MVRSINRLRRNSIFAVFVVSIGFLTVSVASDLFKVNQVMLTTEGYVLIIDSEVGGKSYYNPHPEWPGGYSGITWGIGYDGGYTSKSNILSDWRNLYAVDMLSDTSGITGSKARNILKDYIDIDVNWNLAIQVFKTVDIPRYWSLTKRTFPGFENLCPNAQSALVSLVYNRGSSLEGPRRVEMRQIYRLIPKKDYQGIADQIRAMERLWDANKQRGLIVRREKEAQLIETCIR